MAKTITAEDLREMREEGDELEIHDNGRRSIEGLEDLVAEIRALVEAQRANAGADMLRSETQSELIAAIQKIASRPGASGSTTQTILEDLVVQLSEQKECCDPIVYVFDIERDQRGYMNRIVATPTPFEAPVKYEGFTQ